MQSSYPYEAWITPAENGLADVPMYVRRATETYERTVRRIAVVIDRLAKAEAEAAMHRKSLEQWRKTLARSRP